VAATWAVRASLAAMGYAPGMSLPPDDVVLLEASVEIEIETRAAADAPAHRTIVWIATDGAETYIRSVRGARARWYREATERPEVTIHAPGRRIAARAVPAADETSIARASAALERKYAGDPDLPSMLLPETLDTTIRLEPA
jgi:hypothetical protein